MTPNARCAHLLVGALWCAAACENRDEARLRCTTDPSSLVVQTESEPIHRIALVASNDAALALWSTTRGLYVRPLGPAGATLGPPRPIFASCSAGLAAERHEDRAFLVACARPADPRRGKPGAIHLLTLNYRGELQESIQLEGDAGNPRDVTVGPSTRPDDPPVLSWTRTERATQRVVRQIPGAAQVLASSPTVSASAPMLYRDGDRLVAAWSELWTDDYGLPAGQIVVEGVGRGRPQPVVGITYGSAAATLHRLGEGLVLAYRNDVDPETKTGLFLVPLSDRYSTIGDPRHVARADIGTGPVLRACDRHLHTVAPRTFGSASEVIVGVRTFNGSLNEIASEVQIAKVPRRLTQADAECISGKLLVLYTEEADALDRHGRLYAAPLSCR